MLETFIVIREDSHLVMDSGLLDCCCFNRFSEEISPQSRKGRQGTQSFLNRNTEVQRSQRRTQSNVLRPYLKKANKGVIFD